jgi:hypothetical protein
MSGSYMNALAELICKGDRGNQALLAEIYPDEVKAIQSYQNESYWWEAVQMKAKER